VIIAFVQKAKLNVYRRLTQTGFLFECLSIV